MFSDHFTTNFSQNAAVKKILKIGQYLAKIWEKFCGLLFWATLYLLPISWAAGCTGRERDHLLTTVVTERNTSSFTETTATEGCRLQPACSSDQGTYEVSTHFVTSRLLIMFTICPIAIA